MDILYNSCLKYFIEISIKNMFETKFVPGFNYSIYSIDILKS